VRRETAQRGSLLVVGLTVPAIHMLRVIPETPLKFRDSRDALVRVFNEPSKIS